MGRRILYVMVFLSLLLTAAPSMADAGPNGHGFKGAVDGWETGFVPGPFIPEGRCPVGTEWMLQSAGDGETEGFGHFEWTAAHCSRIVTSTPAGAVGKLADGIMVLTFDDGELTLGYRGSWKYAGDLATGEGIAKVQQTYDALSGKGVFEGARGSGQMGGVDDFGHIMFDVTGSLHVDR